LGFKEICCTLGTALDNEFIRTRADQAELGQDLTERINGVANDVKVLDRRVTTLEVKVDKLDERLTRVEGKVDKLDERLTRVEGKVDVLDTKVTGLQNGQMEMMSILIAIQRKLDIDRPEIGKASAN
jgi:predicted nuclease with TOPRIM domain